jgi:predicted Zn-dependent peptidase
VTGPSDLTAEGVERTEIDGVPVFWAPVAPRLTAALLFRVGRADETVITGGVSHLVEHLALASFGVDTRYGVNGFVDATRTAFVATGQPAEIVAFLAQVCERLADLPVERLDQEARVLRTEAAGRGAGLAELMLWYRFGARGYGLTHLPEHGLEAPTVATVRTWAAERFTAGNAALWISGPVPDGLRLPLPAGPRQPEPASPPIAEVELPAWLNGQAGGVAMSFLAPRKGGLALLVPLVQRRLQRVLRHDQGVSYGVNAGYERLDSHAAQTILAATCLDEHAGEAEVAMADVIASIASSGLTAEELNAGLDLFDRSAQEPEQIYQLLDAAASNELISFPTATRAELRAELAAMSPADSARTMSEAMRSALLLLPGQLAPSRDWLARYPVRSKRAVQGRVHTAATKRFPWSKGYNELVVGDDGVSILAPDGLGATVLYAECAGLVIQPDRRHLLYGLDGFMLPILATDWRDGDRATRAIRDKVPTELTLDLTDGWPGWVDGRWQVVPRT